MQSTPAPAESDALAALVRPSSVALVGASGRADTIPGRLLDYLLRGSFDGPLYPVNPRYEELGGRTCFASLRAIGEQVDLVLVMVPAAMAGDIIDECGEVGAKVAVLFGSGFSETGDEGAAAEAELVERARRAGVRLLGPNCQGVISGSAGLLASFTAAIGDEPPMPGPIAYVGQSGALGGSFLDKARERRLPVGTWVSTGNQADLTAVEVADSLLERDELKIIALYLEDISDGVGFIDFARKARSSGKDLVVIRSGASEVGRRAIQSHTGAMVSSYALFEIVARAEGVYTAGDIDEMLDLVSGLLSSQRPMGPSAGIVSSSGGAGILVADHLSERGLAIPDLGEALQGRLQEYVPGYGSTQNPVDVTAQLFTSRGDDDSFGPALRAVCAHVASDEQVDYLVLVLTMVVGQAGLELAEAIDGLQEEVGKPVFVVWLASTASSEPGRERLAAERIPVFTNVPSLANTIEALVEHQAALPAPADGAAATREVPGPAAGLEATAAHREHPAGTFQMLERWGVSQPAWEFIEDPEVAEQAAVRLGGPLAVKLLADGLEHKTEFGAVRLGVSPDQVVEVCRSMRAKLAEAGDPYPFRGLLLQRMSEPGLELLVSVRREDPSFPPVLTVGIGGVATEIYADVASAPLPLAEGGIERLLQRLQGAALLGPFRGSEPSDVDALVEAVGYLVDGYLASASQVQEIEVNPVIVHPRGAGVSAVDCLVVWRDPVSPSSDEPVRP